MESLSDLIKILGASGENPIVKSSQVNKSRLIELQDQILLYESLQFKNEFSNCLRNYIILVLEDGDINKLKDVLIKYGMVEFQGKGNKDKEQINKQETIYSLVSFLDE